MTIAPLSLALTAYREARRLQKQGHAIDLIDAHYWYPDGVAAVLLARMLNKPVVVTARGTDLNLIPEHRLPRRWLKWALPRADFTIAVCEELRQRAIALGAVTERTRTLRNGVDLDIFAPLEDRAAVRSALGLNGPTLISAGHLIERKGHDLVIEAVAALEGVTLMIVGEGPERRRLEALAAEIGVAHRVRFEGAVSQSHIARLFGASDLLVLASSREGWANVLLEAMACGTPVVATRVGGSAEVVTAPEAGQLVVREIEALRKAIAISLAARNDAGTRNRTRLYAEAFGWEPTARGVLDVWSSVVGSSTVAAPTSRTPENKGT